MNECFTDPILSHFSGKAEQVEHLGAEEGGGAEGEVSYSVSGNV